MEGVADQRGLCGDRDSYTMLASNLLGGALADGMTVHWEPSNFQNGRGARDSVYPPYSQVTLRRRS